MKSSFKKQRKISPPTQFIQSFWNQYFKSTGVDISPIADLLKTEVYQLSAFLGINEDILVAPPTDGLWGDSRTDEDQIGASYPELEWAMQMKDEGKRVDDFEGRQKEVFEIYSDYNTKNQHKMIPIPVCEIPKELK